MDGCREAILKEGKQAEKAEVRQMSLEQVLKSDESNIDIFGSN